VDNLSVFTGDGHDLRQRRRRFQPRPLGVALRKAFGDADSGWLWTPYVTLSAVREFDGENHYAINDVFFGTTTVEGTSFLLELGYDGAARQLGDLRRLNWQDGGAVDSLFGGQLGVRYTFGGHAAPAAAAARRRPRPARTWTTMATA
jgi:outer membrane autotransporter protein